jgi:hypothetical protein
VNLACLAVPSQIRDHKFPLLEQEVEKTVDDYVEKVSHSVNHSSLIITYDARMHRMYKEQLESLKIWREYSVKTAAGLKRLRKSMHNKGRYF